MPKRTKLTDGEWDYSMCEIGGELAEMKEDS